MSAIPIPNGIPASYLASLQSSFKTKNDTFIVGSETSGLGMYISIYLSSALHNQQSRSNHHFKSPTLQTVLPSSLPPSSPFLYSPTNFVPLQKNIYSFISFPPLKVVATRLTQDPSIRVLVLKAGNDHFPSPQSPHPVSGLRIWTRRPIELF